MSQVKDQSKIIHIQPQSTLFFIEHRLNFYKNKNQILSQVKDLNKI